MSTKHTPGPWNAVETMAGTYVVMSGIPPYEDICEINKSNGPRELLVANASLIAAAPELLALLIRYRAEMLSQSQIHALDRDADVIIAKARGTI